MHTLSHNLLPDVAKKLAALLPTLRQSSGYMRRLDSFCFLGALGELYRRETGHPVWFGIDAEAFVYGTNTMNVDHEALARWATGDEQNRSLVRILIGGLPAYRLNDTGCTFADFAAILRGEPVTIDPRERLSPWERKTLEENVEKLRCKRAQGFGDVVALLAGGAKKLSQEALAEITNKMAAAPAAPTEPSGLSDQSPEQPTVSPDTSLAAAITSPEIEVDFFPDHDLDIPHAQHGSPSEGRGLPSSARQRAGADNPVDNGLHAKERERPRPVATGVLLHSCTE